MEIIADYAGNSSWIELSRQAFINNVSVYRSVVESNVLLGCVLKGNAYGHGFYECLDIFHGMVDLIFVINPVDAFKIRNYEKQNSLSNKRIIVLGTLTPSEMVQCARRVIEVSVSDDHWNDYDYLGALKASAKQYGNSYRPIHVHIHIDTGLGREGITLDQLENKIETFIKDPNLVYVHGVMSHFANVEDVTNQEYSLEQIKHFNNAYTFITNRLQLSYDLERHIAQSASTLVIPDHRYDIARVGIAFYGLWPSSETKISARVLMHELPKLKPALSWKCKSQGIKKIGIGNYIGYGCSYRTDRELRICLFPVGYYDGYPRSLSHKAHVLVGGKRCKILGRVMMNHIIVDVTEATTHETPVIGTLIGSDGNETITAEMLAEWAQTINYEIVSRIGAHLKRVVIT